MTAEQMSVTERERADRFLSQFTTVEDFIKREAQIKGVTKFYLLLDDVAARNRAVSHCRYDLEKMADLRNIMIHHAGYPEQILAVPTSDTVAELEKIVKLVTSPPALMPMFRADIRTFSPSDSLSAALVFMKQHDFSQVVVSSENGLRLMTSEAVTR